MPHRALTRRASLLVSLAVAAVLLALKLIVGFATGSLGLISSGLESSGDLSAAALTFFAVRLGARPADADHPYGHRRAENLGALGEAAILLAGGIVVSVAAVMRLSRGGGGEAVHWYELVVIGVALALEAGRLGAALAAAGRAESPTLRANAAHFAADLVGSLAVLAGLLAVRAGWHDGDSAAALAVAAIVFASAIRLIGENANVLMDRAPVEAQSAAERAIAALAADIELDRLRVRESAGRYFADVVVSVPPGQAVVEGHQAADLVEGALERALPGSDVVVHVEPRDRGLDLRERVLAIALAEPLVKEAHDITIFERDDGTCVSLHLKFPAELELSTAHETAERVEQAIRTRPGVSDVQTHLEPLERPLRARTQPHALDAALRAAVAAVVRERTGREPRSVRLLDTDAGHVLFLTLAVARDASLNDAHVLAGELEDELRQRIEGIADVVVHTEP
ncbi:MAG TPA: cation diffusion facilitator family transporter [Solirubrobacteraceae bacterium]|jgi:cation diffusion facilitator family transporter|nr:cation diffusion facilitator family transporter [Solirubrobacteraceae bacterium]